MQNSSLETDATTQERVKFMGIDDETRSALAQIRAIIDRELSAGLDKFYDKVKQTPETRAFFQNETHMARSKDAQIKHWAAVASGNFDGNYVENVRRVGQTHARIGLEPRWYIGGYALILEHIVHAVLDDRGSGASSFFKSTGKRKLAASLSALIKSVLLDMDLSISIYIEAAERARRELEASTAREQERVTSLIGEGLSRIAAQDLTYRIVDDLPEGYQKLREDFNQSIEQLETALRAVGQASHSVHSGSEEISKASNALSRRTEEQAARLEETAAAVNEITTSIQNSASSADSAHKVAQNAANEAEVSGETVTRAMEAMQRIETSSKDITQIIGVIDEIAFQTNLLALNAGVEAARAGEAGRGFAVVASEVRALAQRCAGAAKEVSDLITSSAGAVKDGVDLVEQTGQSLERIGSTISEINTIANDIAGSAKEQSDVMAQINATVHMLDQVTQENAAMSEQATAAGESLRNQGSQLRSLIGGFRLNGVDSDKLRQELQSVVPHAFKEPSGADLQSSELSPSTTPRNRLASGGGGGDWEEF